MSDRQLTRRERNFLRASGVAGVLGTLTTREARKYYNAAVRVARTVSTVGRDRIVQAYRHGRNLVNEIDMTDAPASNLRGSVLQQNNNGTTSSTTQTSIDSSSVKNSVSTEPVIGSHLTLSEGQNIYRPLAMKLGTRVIAQDSIKNMLAYASGSGKVSTEFSGFMESGANVRNSTFMCFRHNLGSNSEVYDPIADPVVNPPTAWPTELKILFPISAKNNGGTLPDAWPGSPTGINAISPYHSHGGMDSWFAPLNISDYENMSWNLNRLKFTTPGKANVPGVRGWNAFSTDSALYQKDAHGCYSDMYLNNITAGVLANEGTIASITAKNAPYKYNMVFNDGRVTYNFMNKGDGPLTATVVVYKLKKGSEASSTLHDYYVAGVPGSQTGFFDQMSPAISAGCKNAKVSNVGTDDLEGMPFQDDDYYLNPEKPFMPISKYTTKSKLPYKEVQRMSFALPSGGRRELCIKLGGDIYDPSSIPDTVNTTITGGNTSVTSSNRALINEHSYVILISTHGAKCTRAWAQGDGNDRFGRMGDMYAPSMLQWDARYTENVGACAFKKPETRTLQVHGNRGSTYGTSASMVTGGFPQAILPQADAARTPSGGTPHIAGTPAPGGTAASMGSGHS